MPIEHRGARLATCPSCLRGSPRVVEDGLVGLLGLPVALRILGRGHVLLDSI